MRTDPRSPCTIRTMSTTSSRGGMKSVTLTCPCGVSHSVSRISVPGRYRPGTLILETEWETPQGHVRVTDFMPPRDEVVDIVRIVQGLRGSVRMHGELALRFDYGQ